MGNVGRFGAEMVLKFQGHWSDPANLAAQWRDCATFLAEHLAGKPAKR